MQSDKGQFDINDTHGAWYCAILGVPYDPSQDEIQRERQAWELRRNPPPTRTAEEYTRDFLAFTGW